METPEGWATLCLGYNEISLPPELSLAQVTAEVEFAQFDVVKNTGTDPRRFLRTLPDVAEVLFETEVNGWQYLSARKRNGAAVSSRFVVLAAARRVGDDIAFLQADASVSLVGDGRDTDILQMLSGMTAVPLADKRRRVGFCVKDVAFLYSKPQLQARFTLLASTALAGAPVNNDHLLTLTLDNTPPTDGGDDRPAAPKPPRDQLLDDVESSSEPFQVGRYDAELVTVTGIDQSRPFVIHDGLVAGTPEPGGLPLVFLNLSQIGEDDPARGAAVVKTILQTMRPN